MKTFFYAATTTHTAEDLAQKVSAFFADRGLDTQTLRPMDSEAIIIQAQTKHSNAKALVGQSMATTVLITPSEGNQLKVEIGNGKWLDKSVLLSVSMLIFWWLSIPAGIGMYRQTKLNKEIAQQIAAYFGAELAE